jgi:hypothetical protein
MIIGLEVWKLPQKGNRDKLISTAEMQRAMGWINELFFGGDISNLIFRWYTMAEDADDLERTGDVPHKCHGRTSVDEQGQLVIILTSDLIAKTFGSYRKLTIISILVHEALHAFTSQYSCGACRTFKSNLFAFGGHRRAWQLLALQLEEPFPCGA